LKPVPTSPWIYAPIPPCPVDKAFVLLSWICAFLSPKCKFYSSVPPFDEGKNAESYELISLNLNFRLKASKESGKLLGKFKFYVQFGKVYVEMERCLAGKNRQNLNRLLKYGLLILQRGFSGIQIEVS
jgi:hypothetical protein